MTRSGTGSEHAPDAPRRRSLGTDARAIARGLVGGSGQATSPLAMAPLNRSVAVSPSRRRSRSRRRPTAMARAKSSSVGKSPSPRTGNCGRGMSCRRAMRRPPRCSDLRSVNPMVSPFRTPADRRSIRGAAPPPKPGRFGAVPTPLPYSTRSRPSGGCESVTICARFAARRLRGALFRVTPPRSARIRASPHR